MSKPGGGSAFPNTFMDINSSGEWVPREQEPGMTLRDWFAGQLLVGREFENDGPLSWISRLFTGGGLTDEEIAIRAYEQADAMLKERES